MNIPIVIKAGALEPFGGGGGGGGPRLTSDVLIETCKSFGETLNCRLLSSSASVDRRELSDQMSFGWDGAIAVDRSASVLGRCAARKALTRARAGRRDDAMMWFQYYEFVRRS